MLPTSYAESSSSETVQMSQHQHAGETSGMSHQELSAGMLHETIQIMGT